MITQHYESKGGTFQSRLFLSFFPRGLGSESVGRAIPNSSYCGPEWPKLLVVTLSEYSGEGEQDKSMKSKTQELRVVITNQNNNAMKAPMSTNQMGMEVLEGLRVSQSQQQPTLQEKQQRDPFPSR